MYTCIHVYVYTHIYIYIYIYIHIYICTDYCANRQAPRDTVRQVVVPRNPKKLSPPPTSGIPRVGENKQKHRITENSLAAVIRGVGISFWAAGFRSRSGPAPGASNTTTTTTTNNNNNNNTYYYYYNKYKTTAIISIYILLSLILTLLSLSLMYAN